MQPTRTCWKSKVTNITFHPEIQLVANGSMSRRLAQGCTHADQLTRAVSRINSVRMKSVTPIKKKVSQYCNVKLVFL